MSNAKTKDGSHHRLDALEALDDELLEQASGGGVGARVGGGTARGCRAPNRLGPNRNTVSRTNTPGMTIRPGRTTPIIHRP